MWLSEGRTGQTPGKDNKAKEPSREHAHTREATKSAFYATGRKEHQEMQGWEKVEEWLQYQEQGLTPPSDPEHSLAKEIRNK